MQSVSTSRSSGGRISRPPRYPFRSGAGLSDKFVGQRRPSSARSGPRTPRDLQGSDRGGHGQSGLERRRPHTSLGKSSHASTVDLARLSRPARHPPDGSTRPGRRVRQRGRPSPTVPVAMSTRSPVTRPNALRNSNAEGVRCGSSPGGRHPLRGTDARPHFRRSASAASTSRKPARTSLPRSTAASLDRLRQALGLPYLRLVWAALLR